MDNPEIPKKTKGGYIKYKCLQPVYKVEFKNITKNKGIKNYWFNTFNPHQYTLDFTNLLFDGHDLLSLLIKDYVNNDKYHISDWGDTDRKIQSAKEQGLVNPISLHPTRKAHKIIADLFLENLPKT